MKVTIIVQARMTSTRLPGKVLKIVLNRPLLEYQLERMKNVKLADEIVVATTTNETDQPIVHLCNRLHIPYYRGPEEDVLTRYYEAAEAFYTDAVVRVTSDCPLIDPKVMERIIQFYIDHYEEFDYVSNTLQRTYPRGMDTEVFSMHVLREAYLETNRQQEREHVTPFIHQQPHRYRLANVAYQTDQSHHRWTVDTAEDFQLIQNILETLYPEEPNFTLEDVLALVDKHPDWRLINAHVEQKKLGA